MSLAQNIDDPRAMALFILLNTRERLTLVFDDWPNLDESFGGHDMAPAADAYREIDKTIARLGGSSMDEIYKLQNEVFGEIPDDVEERDAVAAAIFQHCATLAAR